MGFNAVLGVCRQASRWEESHRRPNKTEQNIPGFGISLHPGMNHLQIMRFFWPRILADLENHDLSPTVPTYKASLSYSLIALIYGISNGSV